MGNIRQGSCVLYYCGHVYDAAYVDPTVAHENADPRLMFVAHCFRPFDVNAMVSDALAAAPLACATLSGMSLGLWQYPQM